IEPRDRVAIVREMLQRDVQQPFLLPKHVAPYQLHEYFGVTLPKLETSVERELYCNQRRCQILSESAIVGLPDLEPRWIEVRCNRPQHRNPNEMDSPSASH